MTEEVVRRRPGAGDVPHRRRRATSGYDDPVLRGHSIEFRINAEDAGRGFLPGPRHDHPAARAGRSRRAGRQRLRAGRVGAGGVRLAARQAGRDRRDRTQALERARRALDDYVVEGMPTVLPFHRAVVAGPGVRDRRRDAVHGAHPMDRDRVRQPDRAVPAGGHGRRGRRAGRARAGHGRGRRPPARGRPARRARRGRPGGAGRRSRAGATGARAARPHRRTSSAGPRRPATR